MSRRGRLELRQTQHHHHVEELHRQTRRPLHQHTVGALDHRDQHGPTLDRHHGHRELYLEHTHSVTKHCG